MNWLKNEYGDVPIFITENGYSDHQGNLDDLHRIYYFKHYINNLLKGIFQPAEFTKSFFPWLLILRLLSSHTDTNHGDMMIDYLIALPETLLSLLVLNLSVSFFPKTEMWLPMFTNGISFSFMESKVKCKNNLKPSSYSLSHQQPVISEASLQASLQFDPSYFPINISQLNPRFQNPRNRISYVNLCAHSYRQICPTYEDFKMDLIP